MADFALKHYKHAAHFTCVATGMAVSGPSPDGFVHVTYYRDRVDLVEELFEMPDGTDMSNPAGPVTLTKKDPPSRTEISREDVVTVLVPIALFDSFTKAFSGMTTNLATSAEGR